MSGQNTASWKVEFPRGSRESPDLDGVPGRLVGRRYPAAQMSTAQSFLFLLILLGAAATGLRLVSRRTPTVPYPVLLALGGILIGLVPGLRLPPIGPDLILLAFVPGLVFEASLSLDLEELRRRVVPIALLATFGVFFTVALIGVASGAAAVVFLRLVQDAELEILITLVLAYGSYLAADVIHASGVVSVVSAGLVVARYGSRTGRLKGTQLHGFWSLLAFVLNAVLFLIVGIALPTHRLLDIAGLALGAYLIMFAARVLPVYGLLGLTDSRGSSIPWPWRHMTVWGGLRGALSVALALSVAAYPAVNPNVSVIAYGMVVLLLVVQGGLLLPVADLLRLRSRTVV